MNDEIKEKIRQWYIDDDLISILDYITNLQQKIEQYENPDDMTLFYMWLDVKAKDKIKDLQQENEYLKKQNDEKTKIGIADHKYASQMEDKVIELQQENERLKQNNQDMQEEMVRTWEKCDNYKSRCEKAIEYINTHYLNANEPELLNILQNGSEKDG